MLDDAFVSMATVGSSVELLRKVVDFSHRLGFQTVTATAVRDHVRGAPEFVWVDNAPAPYRELPGYATEGRRDPVMQHCKVSSVPMLWDQKTYVDAGLEGKWEEQARFGYRTGIALAVHMPLGRHFFIGIDRDQCLPRGDELTGLVGQLQLFAACAQDAALRVLLPDVSESDVPTLTSRELECLCWTMEGKTAWEVGSILCISEQTAVRHLNNATHKLDCVNKHQAVVKALRLGLLC